ncbi:MAG: Crp/Fnr family transcriptional regulator [Pseudomonadota bacterium]
MPWIQHLRLAGIGIACLSDEEAVRMSLASIAIVIGGGEEAAEREEHSRIRLALLRTRAFASLSTTAIDDLAARVTVRRFPAGSLVVPRTDQEIGMLYVVASGRVRVAVADDTGREVTLKTLRPGDFFGEPGILDEHAKADSDIITIEPTTLLLLSNHSLLAHLQAYPQTALGLLSEALNRLRQADAVAADMALSDVRNRLVKKLFALAREDLVNLPEGLLIRRRPTQQELASMVGSCRETISRTITVLVKQGLVVPHGRTLLLTHRLIAKLEPPPMA